MTLTKKDLKDALKHVATKNNVEEINELDIQERVTRIEAHLSLAR